MRSYVLRSAIAPAQGYVCLSCRYRYIRGSTSAQRRYQHDGTLSQDNANATSSEPALANNLGAAGPNEQRDGSEQDPSRGTGEDKGRRRVSKEVCIVPHGIFKTLQYLVLANF